MAIENGRGRIPLCREEETGVEQMRSERTGRRVQRTGKSQMEFEEEHRRGVQTWRRGRTDEQEKGAEEFGGERCPI